MSKLKHEIKEDRIVIEVPEDVTSAEIQEYERKLKKYVVEASRLPLYFKMIDSEQQTF